MKIKSKEQSKTYLELFDVMDSSRKETNLSKTLSYILARNPYALKKLLYLIDPDSLIIKNKKAKLILKNSSIEIERSYSKEKLGHNNESGRTDIEIKIFDNDKLLIFAIIECKIHENRATIAQFEKYKNILSICLINQG
ncbi:MAG: hypothetical protein JXR48_07945 [Candidatus Delongbacteria bacterium]|nr:hypothetical protein [Candidatus Delongbacteria bacterium]MBN2834884.1 hypothetical protein [Candidatus Delongbacteria bacterium]